jgi:rubrerythrin
MPPRYRLACQCFVRNEDILVSFVGDETLPVQRPHVTSVARTYKGGTEISTLDEFFGYAAKLEEDAAIHYDELADAMTSVGNEQVAKLFRQLAGFSRLHLGEVKKRAGSLDLSKVLPPDYAWPNHTTPERTALWAADPNLSRLGGLKAALQGERRGFEFYQAIASTTKSPEVAAAANEFVKEEADHVKILEAWITQEEWATKAHETA